MNAAASSGAMLNLNCLKIYKLGSSLAGLACRVFLYTGVAETLAGTEDVLRYPISFSISKLL